MKKKSKRTKVIATQTLQCQNADKNKQAIIIEIIQEKKNAEFWQRFNRVCQKSSNRLAVFMYQIEKWKLDYSLACKEGTFRNLE